MFARAKAARQRGPITVGRRCCAALITFASATFAFAAAPDIDSISPLAIQSGVPAKIELFGTDISDITGLWASFPAQVESLGGARFRITTAAPVGIGAVRAFGSNGVSNLGFIVVDDLPSHASSKTNSTRITAQKVEFGSAVDGRCTELNYDWFQLHANKGQRVTIETVAARIGSKLDSVLRLVNAAGRELARNDDAPGWSGDSYLSFTAPEAGDYFIELRDVNYAGGSSFFYHLRIGGSAFVSSAFAKPSANAAHEVTEKEPNDTPAKAMKISLGTNISGRFDKANDRDCYEFTARKDERMEFRAATRSLGSPCDVVLTLQSADGKRLARSNPGAADEGVLTHSFDSEGTYRLIVEEATGAFGSNMIYRITSHAAAGFTLTLDTDRVNVAPGKGFDLKVTVARSDYKGAVTLGLEGFPEPLTMTNNVIASGKSNVTMKVIVPEALTPGTWKTFSVIGTAKRNGEELRVRASTAPALRRELPLLLHPPPAFDGVVALGVTAK